MEANYKGILEDFRSPTPMRKFKRGGKKGKARESSQNAVKLGNPQCTPGEARERAQYSPRIDPFIQGASQEFCIQIIVRANKNPKVVPFLIK